jgi:hypothetical protein
MHDHDVFGDIGGEHPRMVVRAAVVVQEEPLDTPQPVELDPFREVVGIVAIDGAGGQISSVTIGRHLGPHSMESLDVFTQDELDDALARPDVIPVCAGDGAFVVAGDQFVRAADSARVTIGDTAAVEAGGWTTIVATDRTHVRAQHAVTIDASGSARVSAGDRVFVRARDAADVMAAGHAIVEASDAATVTVTARATVRATDACKVRALSSARVTVSEEARAWAWGTAAVTARDNARIEAWGSATVIANGSGTVEARENAFVAAGGSVRVKAFGASMVRARGRAQIEAADGVSITRHSHGVEVTGGHVTDVVRFATAEEWCRHYGVDVVNGVATLYKAVDQDFNSYHGTSYRPGSEPYAPDWDGGERECGAGLHFSPRPVFALPRPGDSMRFVACPVRLEDMVAHPQGDYPDQVKARGVCGPVYEVHEDGTPVDPGTPDTHG